MPSMHRSDRVHCSNETPIPGVYWGYLTLSDGPTMSGLAITGQNPAPEPAKVIQPAWVRTVHWINAVAMILMITSGWQIYNASPLFNFSFSKSITLGGWLGGARLLLFAGR